MHPVPRLTRGEGELKPARNQAGSFRLHGLSSENRECPVTVTAALALAVRAPRSLPTFCGSEVLGVSGLRGAGTPRGRKGAAAGSEGTCCSDGEWVDVGVTADP